MSIDKRIMAKIAGGGVAVLAASAIAAAPSALADDTAAPPPPPEPVAQAAAPAPVPHLMSPENLPPGTSDDPVPGTESAGVAYAKSIWQAIQDHDITWRQGLLMLAQRRMDPNARPPAGLSANPQQQGPADPAVAPAPAPDALPPPDPGPAPLPTP